MATLNIKNLPDVLYKELCRRALQERRSVAHEVIHLLTKTLEPPTSRSLLELDGLGKGMWPEMDAAEHVAR